MNVVASASVDQKLDLNEITRKFPDTEYHPGNCSGWYSVSGNFFVISIRSNFWSIVADATTFTISIMGFVNGNRIKTKETIFKER